MKKKRSIILISILIIVSAVIYFYKPQHNKNNSYQLGIIISIGNKDKSNILYYNDQLQKTGQKKLKIGNITSQYDIPKTVNDKVYMIPKGVPYVNEREEVMEFDHNTQKIKLYKIGRPGFFAFDEKDGDIYSDDKNLYKYKFDGEKMHLEASSKISFKGSWKDGYISSFFLK